MLRLRSVVLVVLPLVVLLAGCADDAPVAEEATPSATVSPTAPASDVAGGSTLTAPPEATATLGGSVVVEATTDLGFAVPVDEQEFVLVSVSMPDGTLDLSCRTEGSMGTLTVRLDVDGTLSLLQDTGAGPQVVDSDTLAERDRPSPGEEVALSLLCGSTEEGRSQAVLSVDALGLQVVEVAGDVGDSPYRVLVSSDPPTTVLTAFTVPARTFLGGG